MTDALLSAGEVATVLLLRLAQSETPRGQRGASNHQHP